MHLDASDQTSNFGIKPHIKKGYYPARLISVEPYKDAEGNLVDKQYGQMLIFNFAVYKADDKGKPTEPLQFAPNEEKTKELEDVIIPKFVYHKYKNKDNSLRTAITPKSAITKMLKALGWEFNANKGVELEELLNNWVEVNIDDYEQKLADTGETYKASTVKDVGPYEGPEPGEVKEASPSTPKQVSNQLTNSEYKLSKEQEKQLDELSSQRKALYDMLTGNSITKDAYEKSLEQLKIKEDKIRGV